MMFNSSFQGFLKSLLFGILFITGVSGHSQDLSDLNWLCGRWIIDQSDLSETWYRSPNRDTIIRGYVSSVEQSEEVYEYLRLVKREDGIYYIALPQENSSPVAFKLSTLNESGCVFENPKHDFPKKITYQIIDNKTLKVTVSSEEKSKSWTYYKRDPNKEINE